MKINWTRLWIVMLVMVCLFVLWAGYGVRVLNEFNEAAKQSYETKIQTTPLPDICSVKGLYNFDAGNATETRVYAYVKTCVGSGGTFSEDYAYTACARHWPFEDKVPAPNKGEKPIRCQTTGWVKVK